MDAKKEFERLKNGGFEIVPFKVRRSRYRIPLSADIVALMLEDSVAKLLEERGVEVVQNHDAIAKAADWLCSRTAKDGMLIVGSTGTGKTILATAMMTLISSLKCANVQKDGIYCSYGVLNGDYERPTSLEIVRAFTLARMAANDADRYEAVRNAQFLMIDDIGVEPTSSKNYGNEVSPVIETIYDREDSRKLTIATSNLTAKMLEERYGSRTGSRMASLFDILVLEGKDLRR